MAIASIFLMGFGYWSYNQSLFSNKIKNYFQEKGITSFNNLKPIASLSDRLVIVKGNIVADETFISRKGNKVVLERFQEEVKDKNSNREDWKIIKETKFFRVLPFWLKENSNNSPKEAPVDIKNTNKVLIDAFGLDKTYLGLPEIKTEEINNQLKRTSIWTLSPGQTVHILGNVENKGGQLVINSPNLYKSSFNPFTEMEPFIITSMSVFEVTNKAMDLAKSVYYVSLALFAIGAFFLFNSIVNILKNKNKLQDD